MCVSNLWLKVGSQANDAAMIVQPGMLLGLKDGGIFVAIGGIQHSWKVNEIVS